MPALLLVLAATSAPAQVRPQPGIGDVRIQSVDFRVDQVVLIEVAVGFQTVIELAPDEQIESVAIGDSGAWQATANRAGNRLFLKPMQAAATTNMTVVTNVRTYAFDLVASTSASTGAPYTVRFRYPPSADAAAMPAGGEMIGFYKLRGARTLRPIRISDDGARTFIDWPANVGLPAVYTVDGNGRETLANGNMRGGLYVIDSIAPRLVFRIDQHVVRADRLPVRGN